MSCLKFHSVIVLLIAPIMLLGQKILILDGVSGFPIEGAALFNTSKTKAIIPVHLFGQPADMDSIVRICNEYNLFLVEDCAQSHLAEWDHKKVGTFGVAGTFSFFPGKNLLCFVGLSSIAKSIFLLFVSAKLINADTVSST